MARSSLSSWLERYNIPVLGDSENRDTVTILWEDLPPFYRFVAPLPNFSDYRVRFSSSRRIELEPLEPLPTLRVTYHTCKCGCGDEWPQYD